MKNKSVLNTLLAAGVLLCGSPAKASHESSIIAGHAATLESLSSGMVDEYQESLRRMHRHGEPSRAERRFLASLGNLVETTCRLRRAVVSCSPVCELERGFDAVQRAFDCVEDSADDVEVCSCLRGMMSRFEDAMECLEETGFEVVVRPPPSHHHHGHHSDEGEGVSFGFRIPLPPGLPFEFRRPFGSR